MTYSDYLQLQSLLSSQKLKSAQIGAPAHDETLFIVVHQVYELWFKQMLHDLDSLLAIFRSDYVDEHNMGTIVTRLNRISLIFHLLIEQLPILETMTPLDFLDFRNVLGSSSGFQSFQFRLLENKLGLLRSQRLQMPGHSYDQDFTTEQRAQLEKSESELSLFSELERWLERTPFLQMKGFDFLQSHKNAVDEMLRTERARISSHAELGDEARASRNKILDSHAEYFNSLFDEKRYEALRHSGDRRLSRKATLAALFLHLYRDEPMLQLPFKMLESVLTLDGNINTWRYRHSLMVLRMLGRRMGTGGSSGFDYLKSTVDQHRIFSDFFSISTFLVPRSVLPELPPNVKKELGFHYSGGLAK